MVKERSFIVYLLLSIITCGLYSIYFWYVYTEDLNNITEGDGAPLQNFIVVILLTIVTCGIYKYVWMYQLGNKLQMNGPRYNVCIQENGTTILLWAVLGIFLLGIGPIVAHYFLINNFNELAVRYNYPKMWLK